MSTFLFTHLLFACNPTPPEAVVDVDHGADPVAAKTEARTDGALASAELASPDGTSMGMLSVVETPDGVTLSGKISGLSANATHAMHVHEGSACGTTDFKEAGGHFNPEGHDHGDLRPGSHAGDLGNIKTDADGVAVVDVVAPGLAFGGDRSPVGRTLVVHADEDDKVSQPAGNAGARIACAPIVQQAR